MKLIKLLTMLLFLAVSAVAEVVSYEATSSFPEEDGEWERVTGCEPMRWLESGWLFQQVDSCDDYPPPGGDSESFRRYLTDFIGEEAFFIEWRMQTDGDRSEIPGVAPAAFVAGGFTGVNYHFTIARDQVRFIRDLELPILFVDLEPDLPHTYRLELYSNQLYVWYIDEELIDSGVPEGAYPTHESNNVAFRAKSWYLENTTAWDYIRFGRIPIEGSGDFDSDGDVDLRDFYFFDECLANGGPDVEAGPGCLWADMDGDGDVDYADFSLFQLAFTGSE